MTPVLVLQHQADDGAGYFGAWLDRNGIPWTSRCVEDGQTAPESLEGFSALAILGGAMGANDDLAHLRHEEALIRQAVGSEIPVIGHCLGGQLMARAMGARVTVAAVPEIGWHAIDVLDRPAAIRWFGELHTVTVFQWHYDCFDLPAGATRLAGSRACPNQAFAVGRHLALQFHLEIDASKVAGWVRTADDAYRDSLARHPGSVQGADAMLTGVERHLAAQQALAERIYGCWWSGCRA